MSKYYISWTKSCKIVRNHDLVAFLRFLMDSDDSGSIHYRRFDWSENSSSKELP